MVTFGAALVRSDYPIQATLLTTLGHCYLMMDDLQQAYSAYQQALYHLSDPKVCDLEAPVVPNG
jgi:Tfp pilus assembly protein PilF